MTAEVDLRRFFGRAVAAASVPQALPAFGFLAVILVGSALLVEPWAHVPGTVSYLDALFTSTSAVCVTGLVTVNTGLDYTVAGQVVILALIQIGGLGVMTYAAVVLSLLRRRMSLRTQAALHESLFQSDQARDFKRRFWQIITVTFGIEAVGVLVLFLCLLPGSGSGTAAWSALFHSVSAFCNAGFSIFPGNLMDVRGDHVFLGMIMVLIVAGGLGFVVLHELFAEAGRTLRRRRRDQVRRFSFHTNVVLRTSLLLIVVGTGAVLLFGLTGEETTWGQRIEAALFHSVSARTAGFNMVSIPALPAASLFVLVILMFVGGSPASCAGGVKTTTLALLFARLRSDLLGEQQVRLMGRRVMPDVIRTASLLVALAVGWNVLGLLVLTGTEDSSFQNLLFEQISAFGTVGLSADLTPSLSEAGKFWIAATMYVGRLGPLTLATLVTYRKSLNVTFPEGKVLIG